MSLNGQLVNPESLAPCDPDLFCAADGPSYSYQACQARSPATKEEAAS